jgi:hypothetical protein
MSQRVRGDFAFLDMVAGDTVPDPVEIAIASISQTTTTLTVVLNVAFP